MILHDMLQSNYKSIIKLYVHECCSSFTITTPYATAPWCVVSELTDQEAPLIN